MPFSASKKLEILNKVLEKKETVLEVCFQYRLSRKAFWQRVKLIWERFILTLLPVPPPSLGRVRSYLRHAPLGILFFSGFSFLSYKWLLMIVRASPALRDGLFLASIALVCGTFFFLYSLRVQGGNDQIAVHPNWRKFMMIKEIGFIEEIRTCNNNDDTNFLVDFLRFWINFIF